MVRGPPSISMNNPNRSTNSVSSGDTWTSAKNIQYKLNKLYAARILAICQRSRRRWGHEVHLAVAARSRLSALRMAARRRADETRTVRRALPRDLRRGPRSVRAVGSPVLRTAQQEERRERAELRRRAGHRDRRGQGGVGRVRRGRPDGYVDGPKPQQCTTTHHGDEHCLYLILGGQRQ